MIQEQPGCAPVDDYYKQYVIDDKQLLEQINSFSNMEIHSEMFNYFLELTESADPLSQIKGYVGLRKIFANPQHNGKYNEVIEQKLVMKCISELKQYSTSPIIQALKAETSHILCNLVISSRVCKLLIGDGINLIVKIIKFSSERKLISNLLWTLSNLAADCEKVRDSLIQSEAIPVLIEVIEHDKMKTIAKQAILVLSNIFLQKKSSLTIKSEQLEKIFKLFCISLKQQIFANDQQSVRMLLTSFSKMAEDYNTLLQIGKSNGIIGDILNIYLNQTKYKNSHKILIGCLRFIGAYSASKQIHCQEIINCGFYETAFLLLQHENNKIKSKVCWVLSNIAAGSQSQKMSLIHQQQLIYKLGEIRKTNQQIERQVTWLYLNLTSNMPNHPQCLNFILNQNILNFVGGLLNLAEPKILISALELLANILDYGSKHKVDGQNIFLSKLENSQSISQIQNLQMHQNQVVYKKSLHILEKYFSFQQCQ